MGFGRNRRIVAGTELERYCSERHNLISKAITLGLELLERLHDTGELLSQVLLGSRSA